MIRPLFLVVAMAGAAPVLAQTTPGRSPMPSTQQAPATPATPAAPAVPTAGATVYDPAGGVVGTIDSVTATAVVISTGTNKVAVQPASIGTSPKGLTIGLTKQQIDAAADQQQAQSATQLKSSLVPGATVHGASGAVVGTVKAADDQFVTLTTAKGDVKLPISGFGAGPNGIVIGLTAAQLDAAVGGAAATPQ